MPLRIERQAQEDLRAAADYYLDTADEDIAIRFVDAVHATFERIEYAPHAGWLYREPLQPRLAGLRARRIKGFPFLIFYIVEGPDILVLSILHERRDLPGALQDRFPS